MVAVLRRTLTSVRASRALIVFATQYRELSAVRSYLPAVRRTRPRARGFGCGATLLDRFLSRTRQISPVPWEPQSRLAWFSAPVASDVPGHTARPPWSAEQLTPRTCDTEVSRVNRQTLPVAVYASPASSRMPTQDSLPAAGQRYRVGVGTHWVPPNGFWSHHVTNPPLQS